MDGSARAPLSVATALDLAGMGWPVAPVTLRRNPATGRKMPTYHGRWDELSTADPDAIHQWWIRHGDTIGFVVDTGKAGIVAVDLDVKPDAEIDAPRWWAEQGLPVSPMRVATPGDGLHLYWRARPGEPIANSSGKLAPGVDIRGVGGHLYAPGTRVIDDDSPPWTLLDAPLPPNALPVLPDEVYELLPRSARSRPKPKAGERVSGDRHDRPWILRMLPHQCKIVAQHDKRPGTGFRYTLRGAALIHGRAVEAGLIARGQAEHDLRRAVRQCWGHVDEYDEEWIQTGLDDGEADPWTVVELPEQQAEEQEQPKGLARYLLPRELWDSTPVLKHIYAASMARICSPDAVLHAVLAVVASYLHFASRVDTGKRHSVLSYYFAPIAYSGGGKSEALACARELLAGWAAERFAINGYTGQDYIDAPLGSGEGLIEAFMGEIQRDVRDDDGELVLNKEGNPKSTKVREQARHNALFHTDEGRQALAIDSRKGSTLFAVLCELWSGSVTGQTNAERDRTRKLAEGSYVVAAMMGFQPGTADPLFDDQAGGAPQRFMFAPAEYAPHAENPDAPEEPWPGGLDLQINPGPVLVRLGSEQRALVRRHVRLRAGGGSEDGTLDGHRMLLRCRLAGLLTLLHGDTLGKAEIEVPIEMWDMAGLILDHSCHLRDWLASFGERKRTAQARANDERAKLRAVETEAAKYAAAEKRERERVGRVAAVVGRKVLVSGTEGVTHSMLRDAVGRDRAKLDDAISEALELGWIVRVGKRFRSGPKSGDVPTS
jgi:hypothetical protein